MKYREKGENERNDIRREREIEQNKNPDLVNDVLKDQLTMSLCPALLIKLWTKILTEKATDSETLFVTFLKCLTRHLSKK